MSKYTELRARIEKLPQAMQSYYMARLDDLAKRAYAPEAMDKFLHRLKVAEDLAAPMRTTPAMRIRRGRQ